MRAFISYTSKEEDSFIVSWLAQELYTRGIIAEGTNYNTTYSEEIIKITEYNIKSCDLFIGVIVGSGNQFDNPRVYEEWNIAMRLNKQRIFLIEDTVKLNPDFQELFFLFSRKNPDKAVQQITNFTIKKEKEIRNKKNMVGLLGAAAIISLISKFGGE